MEGEGLRALIKFRVCVRFQCFIYAGFHFRVQLSALHLAVIVMNFCSFVFVFLQILRIKCFIQNCSNSKNARQYPLNLLFFSIWNYYMSEGFIIISGINAKIK